MDTLGIYKITNIINKKYYIGSSINIEKRWKGHIRQLNNNTHYNKHLQRAWNKYKQKSFKFEILETIDIELKNTLRKVEQKYIDSISDWSMSYNICKNTESPSLNLKIPNSKYYYYDSKSNTYKVYYNINGQRLGFGFYSTEQEAIKRANYISSLTEEEMIYIHETEYKGKSRLNIRHNSTKGYCYEKANNKWTVRLQVNGKVKRFGYYLTEQEAKQKADEIKSALEGF